MKEPDNCPNCGVTWIGEPIPDSDREFFGGKTHFRREIGVEIRGKYDGVDHWKCPDCLATFDRSYRLIGEKENSNV